MSEKILGQTPREYITRILLGFLMTCIPYVIYIGYSTNIISDIIITNLTNLTNLISPNVLDWGGFVIGVMASVWRSFNMGYVKETYVLSSVSHVPIIYNSYINNNSNVMIRNIFYTLTSIVGYIRWAKKTQQP